MASPKKPRTPKKQPKHIPPVRDYEAERKRNQRASGTTPKRKRAPKAPVPDVAAMTAPVSGTSVVMSGTAPAPPEAVPDTIVQVPDPPPLPVPDIPLPAAGRLVYAITDGAALAAGAGIGWGNAGMLTGTMEYLNPGWGFICAASLVGGEALAGHLLECNRHIPGAVRTLCVALVLAFPAGEVLLSFVREVAVHQQAVQSAERETSQPVKTQCEREKMPDADGVNAYRIRAWGATQAQRDAAYQTCRDHERAERRKDGDVLVKAADTHSIFETPARAFLAVLMSAVVALAATRFRPFVRSWAGVRIQAPAPVEATKVPAPVPREAWGSWLAHQPARMLGRLTGRKAQSTA